VKIIEVHDSIQDGYSYELSEAMGQNFVATFEPQLTPAEMLELGVFGGDYLNDCQDEFPKDWFARAKLSDHGSDPKCNYFQVSASQPLGVWQKKGWIYPEDPRGWFQWYARYYMGRRIAGEDDRQIKRWRAIRRHVTQLQNNCHPGDQACRPRQRQALLHWAYDSQKL